jgi:hypothetical protein
MRLTTWRALSSSPAIRNNGCPPVPTRPACPRHPLRRPLRELLRRLVGVRPFRQHVLPPVLSAPRREVVGGRHHFAAARRAPGAFGPSAMPRGGVPRVPALLTPALPSHRHRLRPARHLLRPHIGIIPLPQQLLPPGLPAPRLEVLATENPWRRAQHRIPAPQPPRTPSPGPERRQRARAPRRNRRRRDAPQRRHDRRPTSLPAAASQDTAPTPVECVEAV